MTHMVMIIGIDTSSDAQYSLTTYIDTTDTLDHYSARLAVTNELP